MKNLISLNVLFLSLLLSVFVIENLLLCNAVYAAGVLKGLEDGKNKSASKPKKSAKPIKEPTKLVKKTAKLAKKSAKSVEKITKPIKESTKIVKKTTKPVKKLQPIIKLEMVAITGGCFQAGSLAPETESDEKPYDVCVKDFEIGKYEVTQAQWQAMMGDNPSHFEGKNLPVERVSGKDVQNFIAKLNAKTGKNYRLPTENEWFFACQAGRNSEYCGSDSIEAVAWYHGNSGNTSHAVGKKAANAWGLYDMSGNVMEWASSCYEANCSELVLRGGSWRGSGSSARSVIRFSDAPNYRFNSIGFRLALDR